MMATSHSETELEADDVILVKAVALKRVDYDSCLFDCLEIGEAKMHFEPVLGLPRHQSKLLKARIRSKEVRYFALGRIVGQPFHVNRLCRILGILHDLRELLGYLGELGVMSTRM